MNVLYHHYGVPGTTTNNYNKIVSQENQSNSNNLLVLESDNPNIDFNSSNSVMPGGSSG
jgi:hypothetical protein